MATQHATNLSAHGEDIASSYLESCSDAFGHLAAISRAIERLANEHPDLRKLAGAAYYLADEFENLADCWREEVIKNGTRNL